MLYDITIEEPDYTLELSVVVDIEGSHEEAKVWGPADDFDMGCDDRAVVWDGVIEDVFICLDNKLYAGASVAKLTKDSAFYTTIEAVIDDLSHDIISDYEDGQQEF